MARFRTGHPPATSEPLDLLAVGQLIDDAMQPGHFFVAPGLPVEWVAARSEEIAWEVFRGRLLDASQTRQRQTFLAWHLRQPGADEAHVSVKLDVRAQLVHVTRGLLCHVWEGFDAGGEVHSREVTRWTRELVGTLPITDPDRLRDALIGTLWQAVVGTSRLPLHSVEAPLPAFALGQLYYDYRPGLSDDEAAEPLRSWPALIEHGLHAELSGREQAKLLEILLRHVAPDEVPAAAEAFARRWRQLGRSERALPGLLRTLFNEVSLSPWTRFADNALAFVAALVELHVLTLEERVDFLGYLLRQLGRHLIAYDLVTFHHRGANYPDALLLDLVLRQYLDLIEAQPALFDARLRRRALRQACLLRRQYEGHAVPDAPTSPGENARVLPAPHVRVPEEQLLQPHRRRRRLYADTPLAGLLGPHARRVLRQSLADMEQRDELAELGMALFIDRPLGYAKAVGEPDVTPLLTHEAYSPSIARRRLAELKRLADELQLDASDLERFRDATATTTRGLSHEQLAEPARPTACLADVRRVADDFVIVRTLPGGVAELLQACDLTFAEPPWLAVQLAKPGGSALTFFDASYRELKRE